MHSEKSTSPKIILENMFEGPLDLLLHLIRIHEMEIGEVPLNEVTSQYLVYLDAMQELDMDIASEFLVIAATLILMKTRSLLPIHHDESSDHEELDDTLSSRQLIRRLIEFRKFKELAQRLSDLESENRGVFYRAEVIPILPTPELELPTQDIRTLFEAFTRVFQTVKKPVVHTVQNQTFKVEDKLTIFRERLNHQKTLNLQEVFEACSCKEEIIVSFLATLELAKLREIVITQANPYEDILIQQREDKVIYVG